MRVCTKKYTKEQKLFLMKLIDEKYRISLTLDGIPCSRFEHYMIRSEKQRIRSPGYDVGSRVAGRHYMENHVGFVVRLSSPSPGVFRIVGFEANVVANAGAKCNTNDKRALEDYDEFDYTVSVRYEMSDLSWYKRWNDILTVDYNPVIHWLSLGNTVLLVLAMTVLVVVVLVMSIRRDFNRGGQTILDDEALEETGWKLVHGDAFRPPQNSDLICSCVGSGLQLVLGSVLVVAIAAIGFLAPLNTGSMVTSIAVIFVVVAPFGGAFAGKLFKTIGSGRSINNYFSSASLFIGPVLCLYIVANVVLTTNGSSAAITKKVISELSIMVGVLDLGLFGLGYLVGIQSSPFALPARVNSIARSIPKQPTFLASWVTIPVAGMVIFAAIYVQVYFIFMSFWTNLTYYYLFGLLLVVLLLMLLLSCEVSIFVTYLNLNYENHRWWWPAFYVPASVAVVFYVYTIYYMAAIYRPVDLSSVVIYSAICTGVALALGLGNGCVGFISSFIFVQSIYGALKME